MIRVFFMVINFLISSPCYRLCFFDIPVQKQYNQQMYFQDAFALETHLNNDWTTLLKNLKQREDNHFQLLQYNKKIIHEQKQEDIQVFMQDKIQQHKRQLSKVSSLCIQMERQEAQILQKYEGNVTVFEQIVKLTERVGARILQICQYSIDKCKSFDQQLVTIHNKMKVALVKQISQKSKVNLEEVIKIVINYAKTKLNNEVQKLKKLITGLQNGQFDKLQQIYFPRVRKISLKIQKPINKSVQKAKVSSVGREDKSPPIRQEIKKLEKIKKQKQKLATKMVYGLYSTMELSKAQFIEDMCGNEKQKVTRLYNQIFSRNKFNYEQIIAFEAKKELFQEKVKIFKQMMQRESKIITQVLIRKPIRQKKSQEMSKSLILKTNQNQTQEEQPEQFDDIQKKNLSVNRYRISSPRGKKQTKDGVLCFNNMLQSTQQNFNHFKFDASGQQTYLRTNRNRLPYLPNLNNNNYRASSFQQRLQTTKNKLINQKQKYEKQQSNLNLDSNLIKNQRPKEMKNNQEKINSQRVKMILKNCEVGVQGVMRKVQSIGKEKKKVEPNPMQYTFYVRKSGNKFYQPRTNINF